MIFFKGKQKTQIKDKNYYINNEKTKKSFIEYVKKLLLLNIDEINKITWRGNYADQLKDVEHYKYLSKDDIKEVINNDNYLNTIYIDFYINDVIWHANMNNYFEKDDTINPNLYQPTMIERIKGVFRDKIYWTIFSWDKEKTKGEYNLGMNLVEFSEPTQKFIDWFREKYPI